MLPVVLLIFAVQDLSAQQANSVFVTQIKSNNGDKSTGLLTHISTDSLQITTKNRVVKSVALADIKQLKVLKRRNDLGYAILTGALATGAIITAQTLDDGGTATLVGIGGSAVIVTAAMLLHNAIHKPELKIESTTQPITYQLAKEKLLPYMSSR